MLYCPIASTFIACILSIAYALAGLRGGKIIDIAFFSGSLLSLIFVEGTMFPHFISLALILAVALWFANNYVIAFYWAVINFSISFSFVASIFALLEIDCLNPTRIFIIFPMAFALLMTVVACRFWAKSDKQNRKIIFSCLAASIQLLLSTFELLSDSWLSLFAVFASFLLYLIGYFVQQKTKAAVEIL